MNQPIPELTTKLLEACNNCDFDAVMQALEAGADVNQPGEYNHVPIASVGHNENQAEIAALLVEHGADINAPGYDAHGPLALRAYGRDVDYVKILLELGADPNQAHPGTGETPLHLATAKANFPGATECVRLLLAAGANPNARTIPGVESDNFWRDTKTVGETPLHRAAAFGDEEMMRLMVGAGADPSIKDINNQSALTWFSMHKRDEPTVHVDKSVMRILAYGEWKNTIPDDW